MFANQMRGAPLSSADVPAAPSAQLVRNAGGKTSSLETAGGISRSEHVDSGSKASGGVADNATTTPEKALDIDSGRGKIFEIGL